jgi:hypothetical protein
MPDDGTRNFPDPIKIVYRPQLRKIELGKIELGKIRPGKIGPGKMEPA